MSKKAEKGSQKWMQYAVNERQELLNQKIAEQCDICTSDKIEWQSPLKIEQYKEYRDGAFLDKLGLSELKESLRNFWPAGGPVWDGLAKVNNRVLLIEAKSHIAELVSNKTGAGEESKQQIEKSLEEVKKALNVDSDIVWSGKLYQYTNRIAHLNWLREQDIPAYLLNIYFMKDSDMDGPKDKGEWQAAITVVKEVLGLGNNHSMAKYMRDVFVDVNEIK